MYLVWNLRYYRSKTVLLYFYNPDEEMMKKLLLGTLVISALFSVTATAENKTAQAYVPVEFSAELDGNEYHFKPETSPQRIVSLSRSPPKCCWHWIWGTVWSVPLFWKSRFIRR